MKRNFLYILLAVILLSSCNRRNSEHEFVEDETETTREILVEKEISQIDEAKGIKYEAELLNSAIEKGNLGELDYYVLPNDESNNKLKLDISSFFTIDQNQYLIAENFVLAGKYYISEKYGVVIFDDSNQPFSDYIRWKVITIF